MSKAVSLDLRERVLAALAEGMSGRQAAARFRVSAASVSRWRALVRAQGTAAPGALGGDRRSARIEAPADLIRTLLAAAPDQSLAELRARLAAQGVTLGYGGLWRFFARHRITRKKRRRTRPSRTAPTS
jgi:transposase